MNITIIVTMMNGKSTSLVNVVKYRFMGFSIQEIKEVLSTDNLELHPKS